MEARDCLSRIVSAYGMDVTLGLLAATEKVAA
jgi:hypothetical protein